MKAIHIVGRKKSGKTSLIVRLLPSLRACGLKVGTVKHSRQPHTLDVKDTDSWKHREAGAEATLVLTPSAGAFHFSHEVESVEVGSLLAHYLGEMDLVLVEGWKDRPATRIEVLGAADEGEHLPLQSDTGSDLLAVVFGPAVTKPSVDDLDPRLRAFMWDDPEGVAAAILDWMRLEETKPQ